MFQIFVVVASHISKRRATYWKFHLDFIKAPIYIDKIKYGKGARRYPGVS